LAVADSGEAAVAAGSEDLAAVAAEAVAPQEAGRLMLNVEG